MTGAFFMPSLIKNFEILNPLITFVHKFYRLIEIVKNARIKVLTCNSLNINSD
jgi:hypothetical protein